MTILTQFQFTADANIFLSSFSTFSYALLGKGSTRQMRENEFCQLHINPSPSQLLNAVRILFIKRLFNYGPALGWGAANKDGGIYGAGAIKLWLLQDDTMNSFCGSGTNEGLSSSVSSFKDALSTDLISISSLKIFDF